MLTQTRLKEVLAYTPGTGTFRWRVANSNRIKVGDVAGTPHNEGYIHIRIDGKRYLAHRLAWLYMTGEWPEYQIDHRDGIRNNNWFSNLRVATNAQNSENRKNVKGYSWHKNSKCWRVRITLNGKVYQKYFKSEADAREWYLQKKKELHTFNPEPRQ